MIALLQQATPDCCSSRVEMQMKMETMQLEIYTGLFSQLLQEQPGTTIQLLLNMYSYTLLPHPNSFKYCKNVLTDYELESFDLANSKLWQSIYIN